MNPASARVVVSSTPQVRPFLKWAGGKRQLLPALREFYPRVFGRYIEPFAGSGAVFFDLAQSGALRNSPSCLIDSNLDLIGCYFMLRDRVNEVLFHLRALDAAYRKQRDRHFYAVRDTRFNPLREKLRADGGLPARAYTPELAAMLIFLNRTGFNGLFRLNSKGGFNVPHGRYANPRICDEQNLRAVSAVLSDSGVEILHESFDHVLKVAGSGDFVYFDPPYAPLTATSDFTSYTSDGFNLRDQERLRNVVLELASRGCQVLVSNSTATEIKNLYTTLASRRAHLVLHRVPAKRAINSDPSGRGTIDEYLITNIVPH